MEMQLAKYYVCRYGCAELFAAKEGARGSHLGSPHRGPRLAVPASELPAEVCWIISDVSIFICGNAARS
jgi:hypothetical protein